MRYFNQNNIYGPPVKEDPKKSSNFKFNTEEGKPSGESKASFANVANAAFTGIDLLQTGLNADKDIDTSGQTDYGDQKAEGGMLTVQSTAKGAAAGMQIGGPVGAAIGGGLGFVSGLFGANKRKKALKNAKRRFRARKSYDSQEKINEYTEQQSVDGIVTNENKEYMAKINSPGYRRFKRY